MFRILHISDLHARESTRWSTDTILNAATAQLVKESDRNNFDVVAFTGDVAYSGKPKEYEIAEEWISKCFLSTTGLNLSEKRLLFVPGNHDVDRPTILPPATAIENELARAQSQDDVAKYYGDPTSLKLLLRRHSQYSAFCARVRGDSDLSLPSWSQSFDFKNTPIVFEGLCTSWLSRGPDDHHRLLVGQPQLTERDRQRPKNAFLVAMLHHPLIDLMPFDERNTEHQFRNYHSLILRGHLHVPDGVYRQTNSGEYLELAAGALYESHDYPNRFSVIDLSDDLQLVHVRTYLWSEGRWIHDRNLYNTQDGDGHFQVRHLPVPQPDIEAVGSTSDASPTATAAQVIRPDREGQGQTPAATDQLAAFPRFTERCLRHHRGIRQNAQETALLRLQETRLLEVLAEWGTHPLSFISTVLERLRQDVAVTTALHARCGGCASGKELQACFDSQSQLTSTAFGDALRRAGAVFLLLDDVRWGAGEAARSQEVSLDETIRAFLDHCPQLYVIALSYQRHDSAHHGTRALLLEPLDAADTRSYMSLHEKSPTQLESIVDYDRVLRATGGLPRNIDTVLEALAFTNLNGALAQFADELATVADELPPHVVDAVAQLASAPDDLSSRAYTMLTLLCVLDNGEALSTIKRIIPQAPLWATHAKYLQDMGLLDVAEPIVSSRHAATHGSTTDQEKLLRAPRLVRDHVLSTLTEADRVRITKDAASVYFGADWRSGSIRVRHQPSRPGSAIRLTSGNDIGILHQIVTLAFVNPTLAPCSQEEAVRLVLKYLHHLIGKGLYGECYTAARDLIAAVEIRGSAEQFSLDLAEINLIAAKCARMVGELTAAIEYLNVALPAARAAGAKKRLSDVLTVLAMVHDSLGHEHEACQAAKEVLDIGPKESGDAIQSKAILAEYEPDPAKRKEQLVQLERRARSRGHLTVANNIALTLAAASENVEESLRRLSVVRSGPQFEYNYIRATIRRVDTLLKNNRLADISVVDVHELERSYAIVYTQRISALFNLCHRVMWDYYEKRGDRRELGNLFSLSSFMWRLSGDSEHELEYATKLAKTDHTIFGSLANTMTAVLRYCNARVSELSRRAET